MSRYDNDDVRETKGVVTSLKKNVKKESKNGKRYTVHVLKIEDSDGEERKYQIGVKSRPAKFVVDLNKGDQVTVKEAENDSGYMNVVAVLKPRSKSKFSGGGGSKDATGAIQGMILKSAVDRAVDLTVKDIVEAAAIILEAKEETDKLVVQALRKDKAEDEDDDVDEEDEDDDEESDDDEEDDEDDSRSKKKNSKKKGKKSKADSPY